MKLPNAEGAIIDLRKLTDYVLNLDDPRGRHKARVFLSALGMNSSDSEELRAKILKQIQDSDAVVGEADIYGQRYTVDCRITTDTGEAVVRTGWIIRKGETAPRLTTCFVKRKDEES